MKNIKEHIMKKMFRSLFFSLLFFFATCVAAVEKPDLVNLKDVIPNIKVHLYYATEDNFTKAILYNSDKCYLLKEAAEKLKLVQEDLEKQGFGLKVWDGYRPLSAQKKMWKVCPDPRYVADPKKGSVHNRGASVDVTLIDLKTGEEVEMPTAFDDFSEKASIDYTKGISEKAIEHRSILQKSMQKHGFQLFKTEWWHFNYQGFEKYEVLDINIEDIE